MISLTDVLIAWLLVVQWPLRHSDRYSCPSIHSSSPSDGGVDDRGVLGVEVVVVSTLVVSTRTSTRLQ